MAPIVDDIELVFFESLDFSNIPNSGTVDMLRVLRDENDISYTVHFPIDKRAAAQSGDERAGFLLQVKKIIELTRPLEPYGYILHLEPEARNPDEAAKGEWQKFANEICTGIAAINGLDLQRICIENLSYPYEWNIPFAERFNFSFCLDIGHLLMNDINVTAACKALFGRTRIVHFHGIDNGKDHCSLGHCEPGWLREFTQQQLKNYQQVVTLEVFNEHDTFSSIKALEVAWDKNAY